MIINKTTHEWQILPFTSKNITTWPDEDIWNIPDGSELANKILAAGPLWTAVTDSNGMLINCTPIVTPFVEETKDDFRYFRKVQFAAFDIYKSNVEYGIEIEDESRRTEILTWYNTMLDFPDQITEYNYLTIEYPATPECIKRYL